jgi:hypothetical protein
MAEYGSPQYRKKLFETWHYYLLRFPWEWLATLTFEPGTDYYFALRRFKKWRFKIIDTEKLRIGACLLTFLKDTSIHFHVLMLGHNRNGKSLIDCSRRKWSTDWLYLGCKDPYCYFERRKWEIKCYSKIRNVHSGFSASNYMAKHTLKGEIESASFDFFDMKLFKKYEDIQQNELAHLN